MANGSTFGKCVRMKDYCKMYIEEQDNNGNQIWCLTSELCKPKHTLCKFCGEAIHVGETIIQGDQLTNHVRTFNFPYHPVCLFREDRRIEENVTKYGVCHKECFTEEELAEIDKARNYCSLLPETALEQKEELCSKQTTRNCDFCQEKFCDKHMSIWEYDKDSQTKYDMCDNCQATDKSFVKIVFDVHGLEYTPQVESMSEIAYPFSILAEALASEPQNPLPPLRLVEYEIKIGDNIKREQMLGGIVEVNGEDVLKVYSMDEEGNIKPYDIPSVALPEIDQPSSENAVESETDLNRWEDDGGTVIETEDEGQDYINELIELFGIEVNKSQEKSSDDDDGSNVTVPHFDEDLPDHIKGKCSVPNCWLCK